MESGSGYYEKWITSHYNIVKCFSYLPNTVCRMNIGTEILQCVWLVAHISCSSRCVCKYCCFQVHFMASSNRNLESLNTLKFPMSTKSGHVHSEFYKHISGNFCPDPKNSKTVIIFGPLKQYQLFYRCLIYAYCWEVWILLQKKPKHYSFCLKDNLIACSLLV